MSYGALIRDAFSIAWRNRYLWFFGFFAASGAPSFNYDYSYEAPGARGAGETASSPLDPGVLIALLLGGLLLLVLFIVLSVISHGGLADSVAAIDRRERRSFRATWRAGRTTFWRVLGLGILLILLGLALVIATLVPIGGVLAIGFLAIDEVAAEVIAVVLAIVLGLAALVFVFIPFTVIAQFALRELVLGGTGMRAAIGAGWRLFRRNFGRSLLVWVIDFGISLGVGLAILLAALLLAAPLLVLGFSGSEATLVVGIVTGLVLVPLFIVAVAAVGAFRHAYWTLAYLRLEPPAA